MKKTHFYYFVKMLRFFHFEKFEKNMSAKLSRFQQMKVDLTMLHRITHHLHIIHYIGYYITYYVICDVIHNFYVSEKNFIQAFSSEKMGLASFKWMNLSFFFFIILISFFFSLEGKNNQITCLHLMHSDQISEWNVLAVPERPHITLLLSSIFFLVLLFVENSQDGHGSCTNTCTSATLSFCPYVVQIIGVLLSTKKWLWMKDFSGVSGWSLIQAKES